MNENVAPRDTECNAASERQGAIIMQGDDLRAHSRPASCKPGCVPTWKMIDLPTQSSDVSPPQRVINHPVQAPYVPCVRSYNDSKRSLKKPLVLIIVTGGTICMIHSGVNSSLKPAPLAERLPQYLDDPTLPDYDVLEWEELLDSSDVSLCHWLRMAQDIYNKYAEYDGFVVLHGTDSLAYTASAMSFILENLGKPVIFTGAMLPMHHIQTDARRNLAVALVIAGYSQITEVCVLFGSRLLRGNRTRKLDCSQMDAFQSPNYPPLGRVGVDVTMDEQLLLAPGKRGFRIFHHMCMNIVIVMVTPGFHAELLRNLFKSPTRPLGVILQLYGTGTLPVRDEHLLQIIKGGIEQGVDIVAVSQCPSGTCSLLTYENGALLYNLGVIEGKDMTPEAAFAKLAYLMGKGYTGRELKTLMEKNIRGEVTERPLFVTGQFGHELPAIRAAAPAAVLGSPEKAVENSKSEATTLTSPSQF